MPDQSVAGYTEVTWAEDRATRGRDPSAEPGAKTGVGGRTPPLGIPGIGRKAINPITCICISEWRSEKPGIVACTPCRQSRRLQGYHAWVYAFSAYNMRGPYGPPKEALSLLASRAARHMSGSPGQIAANSLAGTSGWYGALLVASIAQVSDFVLGSYVLCLKPKTKSDPTHRLIRQLRPGPGGPSRLPLP